MGNLTVDSYNILRYENVKKKLCKLFQFKLNYLIIIPYERLEAKNGPWNVNLFKRWIVEAKIVILKETFEVIKLKCHI